MSLVAELLPCMATIPQKELRNNVGDVLRRAEAGEELTITVAGRPVAGWDRPQTPWVPSAQLADCGDPAGSTLEDDLEGWAASWSTPGRRRAAVLLDTSVLIAGTRAPADEAAISVVSLAELHFGVLVATDDEGAPSGAATRCDRGTFRPAPRRCWRRTRMGSPRRAVAERGGQPRRRAIDLAIAATANVHGVPLLTLNPDDFKLIDDLVDVRVP